MLLCSRISAESQNVNIGALQFLQPAWLLVALACLIAAFYFRQISAHSSWVKIIAPHVLNYLGGQRRHQSGWNLTLVGAAVTAIALSQPVLRQSDDNTWRHSTGWVVLVDVSRSMTLNDIVPSRLSAAREALSYISEAAGARPISLILYTADAFLVAPPAFDRSVFNEHAALLEHGIIPLEGSNLARALSLSSSVIEGSDFIQANVILLTDTGGIGKSSIAAAQFLASAGHTLDLLVFGVDNAYNDDSETGINVEAANELASSGNGRAIFTNRFGVLDFNKLRLNEDADPSTHSDLETLVWRLQSHWLLIFIIPILLSLFRQEARS